MMKVAVASAFLAGAVTLFCPYADLSMNGFGYSANRIGVNAAMPALVAFAGIVAYGLFEVVPSSLKPVDFYGLLVVWGGVAGRFYTSSLAILADQFKGTQLARATAVVGGLYAVAVFILTAAFAGCLLVLPRWGRVGL
jgi:hypothetical protein